MTASLALTEAVRRAGRWTATQTWKALGGVEVEVSTVDERTQAQEALYQGHLSSGVGDEPLAVDEKKSSWDEAIEPRSYVARVHTEPDRTPRRVHPRRIPTRGYRQALEAGFVGLLGRRLRVVGQRSNDRVSDDDQQPDVT